MANGISAFLLGILANPFEIVYNRIVSEQLFPPNNRRNYTGLVDGLTKCLSEGVLMRGAFATALSYGIFFGSISSIYDFLKEYYYYFFGPTYWLRPACLSIATGVGCYLSLPFDNIKTRMHTMSALPDGRLPYTSVFDCFFKIWNYECNYKKYSNLHAFHTSFVPYYLRCFTTLYMGVLISDYAFRKNYQEDDFIEDGDFYRGPHIKEIYHMPHNRSAINKEIQNITPKKTYFVNNDKTTSFKI
jgi:hypothetical protein